MSYEPPRTPYNRRRLSEIDQTGILSTGCRSCRQGAIDSYLRAGWIAWLPNAQIYALTDLGREVLNAE